MQTTKQHVRTATTLAILSVVLGVAASQSVRGQTSAFRYQGQLKEDGVPANGSYNLVFNAASGGAQVGSTITRNGISITDGLFAEKLDFGATPFDGSGRWLEVSANGIPLTPRQEITATPYALKTKGVDGHSLDSADGSQANVVYVSAAGSVGIGTTNPTSKLEIAGQDGLAITGLSRF